jgi:hypothetical protein
MLPSSAVRTAASIEVLTWHIDAEISGVIHLLEWVRMDEFVVNN